MYPELSRRLREQTGIDNGYHVCGGLELMDPGEPLPVEEWRAEGIAFAELEGDALRAVEPALSPALPRAYHLPDMAQVRNPRHLKALHRRLRSAGRPPLPPPCRAIALVRTGRRIDAVQTDQGALPAGQFLVAAGAWTDGLLESVGSGSASAPCAVRSRCFRRRQRGRARYCFRASAISSRGPTAGCWSAPRKRTPASTLGPRPPRSPGCWPSRRNWSRPWRARPWSAAGRGCDRAAPMDCRSSGVCRDCANLFVAAGHFRAGIQLSPATGRS